MSKVRLPWKSIVAAALGLGVLIALFYYIPLGFLPAEGWSALTILAPLIASIALIVLLMLMSLVAPLWFFFGLEGKRGVLLTPLRYPLSEWVRHESPISPFRVLLFLAATIGVPTAVVLLVGMWKTGYLSVWVEPMEPFIDRVCIPHANKSECAFWGLSGPLILLGVCIIGAYIFFRPLRRQYWVERAICAILMTLSAVPSLLVVLLLLSISDYAHERLTAWALAWVLFGTPIFLTGANWAGLFIKVHLEARGYATWAPVVAGALVAFIVAIGIILLGLSRPLTNWIMERTTTRVRDAFLLVDAKDCSVLRTHSFEVVESPDGTCYVGSVVLLSRVGEEWLVSSSLDAATTVSLKRSAVRTWGHRVPRHFDP